MLNALLLILLVTAGGLALTYWYEDEWPLTVRLAVGFVTGITAQALMCFALALHFRITLPVIIASALPLALPLLIFRSPEVRKQFRADGARLFHLHGRSRHRFPHLILSLLLTGMLIWVFSGVVYFDKGGLYTNNHHNYGDLPWHVALVRGFTVGGNYPPEHLQFAGSRLTYPYLCDFITAEFIGGGANLVAGFLFINIGLALCLLTLLQQVTFRLTRYPLAMMAAPLLLFFNGGWGWLMLINDLFHSKLSPGGFFMALPHDYTMYEDRYRWGSTITVLFTTQRSLLLGMPIALGVMLLLHSVLRTPIGQRRTRLLAAGCITGLLPLAHTHTALVLLVVATLYALPEFIRDRRVLREWLAFFVPASLLMAPQGLMLLSGTSAHTSHYFGFELGWDHGKDNPIVFWLRNTGPFIPLLLVGLLWRKPRLLPPTVRRFFLPFGLWLILPNVLRFAPWVWDNIKVIIYGYVASIPVVLLVLRRLCHQKAMGRFTALALLIMMTLAGSVDVFRVATGQFRQRIYSREELEFGEAVNRAVPPAARIIHAPEHNHAITYAGRRLLCGYGGHLWSHGFDFADRAEEVKRIYAGAPDADALLDKYQVQYIAVGPPEYHEPGYQVNDTYLNKFPATVSVGQYRLLRVR